MATQSYRNRHETSVSRARASILGPGIGTAFQPTPFQRSASGRKFRTDLSARLPTARHWVLVQEIPYSALSAASWPSAAGAKIVDLGTEVPGTTAGNARPGGGMADLTVPGGVSGATGTPAAVAVEIVGGTTPSSPA